MAILAAAAALVLPNLPRLAPGLMLDSSSAEAAAILRQARGAAIRASRPVEVQVADGVVGIAGLGSRALPAVARPPIAFYPDGSSSGGELVLAAGGRQRSIAVDPLTGRISP